MPWFNVSKMLKFDYYKLKQCFAVGLITYNIKYNLMEFNKLKNQSIKGNSNSETLHWNETLI